MSNTVLHKANTRGRVDHGWLQSWPYLFSFVHYNPETHFVLRYERWHGIVAWASGTHPHDNMEIISILLEGDSNTKTYGQYSRIRNGDVQVMSAGTVATLPVNTIKQGSES